MILREKSQEELAVDFDSCTVYTKLYCMCDYCDLIFKRSKRNILVGRKTIQKESCNSKVCAKRKREESQLLLYGVKNAGGSVESLKKYKKTCLDKYGVENSSSLSKVKEKTKHTNLLKYGKPSYLSTKECSKAKKKKAQELYGVNFFAQSPDIKQKIKKTNIQKYGVEHPMQNKGVQKKVKETCLTKYGVSNVSSVPEIRTKQLYTLLKNYGVNHPLQSKEIKNKQEATLFKNYGVLIPLQSEALKDKRKKTCLKTYGFEYPIQNNQVFKKMLETKMEKYGSYYPNFKKTEFEIKNWLNSFGFDFQSNIEILNGKEIDLFDKKLLIAIEYCGLYWHNEHSPEPRKRLYHFEKYKKCLEQNIQLITIFEDEWHGRKDQCQNFLKSKIKVYDKKVFARKCSVDIISNKTSKLFHEENHIQGSPRGMIVAYGLFYENKLIGVMSLGRHHRNSSQITLDRFCVSSGHQISGGASKLFKACTNWAANNNYSKIISWSDNRWSNGNLYKKLGFKLEKKLVPDYSYVNMKNPNKIRISKQSQAKKNTKCPKNKTEVDWCTERGMARIWDCGKIRWTYNIGN